MIARLCGIVIEREGAQVLLDVHGVGYEIFCSTSCASKLQEGVEATILVYTVVKEDLLRLYGFADKLEKQVFLLLNKVKGIGPKSALDTVSKVDSRDLLRYIGAGDLTSLSRVKGLGKKTAERIIVELKDKVTEFAIEHKESSLRIEKVSGDSAPREDALLALQALGFPKKDAERALQSISNLNALETSGEIVREALQYI